MLKLFINTFILSRQNSSTFNYYLFACLESLFVIAECNEGLGVEFLNRNFTLKGPSAILVPTRCCEFDMNYLSF